MTKTTVIFNQDDPIGTIWANTKVVPIELYERREGMFKFIGYEKKYFPFIPRKRCNKPHKKDIWLPSMTTDVTPGMMAYDESRFTEDYSITKV